MRLLTNETLIDSYFRALDLELEEDFIDLLMNEIKRRKIKLPKQHSQAQAN